MRPIRLALLVLVCALSASVATHLLDSRPASVSAETDGCLAARVQQFQAQLVADMVQAGSGDQERMRFYLNFWSQNLHQPALVFKSNYLDLQDRATVLTSTAASMASFYCAE